MNQNYQIFSLWNYFLKKIIDAVAGLYISAFVARQKTAGMLSLFYFITRIISGVMNSLFTVYCWIVTNVALQQIEISIWFKNIINVFSAYLISSSLDLLVR